MRRVVAVLAAPTVCSATPPGVDPGAFGRALIEDTCDLVSGLELVSPALAISQAAEAELAGGRPPENEPSLEELTWPQTPVIRLARGDSSGLVMETLDWLGALGAQQGAVLAADAPDLPPLLIGKLLRALGTGRSGADQRTDVAVCPADDGGLVAIAAWLPVPDWLTEAGSSMDDLDAVGRLRAATPRRRAFAVGPGWHRLREPADLNRLDPGLEGWAATRAILTGQNSMP